MTREDFIQKYGSIYEHSPWVAAAAFGSAETIDALQTAMRDVVDAASHAQKLALLCAHPDLACAPAERKRLTASSVSEQAGAGLDACTPEEFAAFQNLNAAYKRKFGFPFIIAVTGLTRSDILAVFQARMLNDAEEEFATAIQQVHKIARIRLEKLA